MLRRDPRRRHLHSLTPAQSAECQNGYCYYSFTPPATPPPVSSQTSSREDSKFARSFYIRFAKITLPIALAQFCHSFCKYNVFSNQAFSLSTLMADLASHL